MSIRFRASSALGGLANSPFKPVTHVDGSVSLQGVNSSDEFDHQFAYVTGSSHDVLLTLALWSKACALREETSILLLPYLPGALSSGQFFADYINNFVRPDLIVSFDPFSFAASRWFPERRMVRDHSTTGRTIGAKSVPYFVVPPLSSVILDATKGETYVGVITLDVHRDDHARGVAESLGVPIFRIETARDPETGEIFHANLSEPLPSEGTLLLVDKFCGSGDDQVAYAEASGLPRERLNLWASHSVFSDGFEALSSHFGTIHTTDSLWQGGIQSVDGTDVRVHELLPYLERAAILACQ